MPRRDADHHRKFTLARLLADNPLVPGNQLHQAGHEAWEGAYLSPKEVAHDILCKKRTGQWVVVVFIDILPLLLSAGRAQINVHFCRVGTASFSKAVCCD